MTAPPASDATGGGYGPGWDPDGDALVWRHPARGLLTLRRLVVLLVVVPVTAVVATSTAVLGAAVAGAVVAAVGLAVLAACLVVVTRRWRAWGWAEREDDLLVRRGVLVRTTTVVPYGRMQFVDVYSGPLERRFGLASVRLHTAAAHTQALVPGLPLAEATRLRDHLAALGEARQAGL